MPAVSSGPGAYRDFTYPLNVFMHILTHEEGEVMYLHYGLFERPDEPLLVAQERSTGLLISRLPAAPARLLEVGIGLGTTMARLAESGYDVTGITPDASQIEMVRARHPRLNVQCVRFEDFAGGPFDAVFFQESSQYIDSDALFAKARGLTSHVIVLDEFSMTEEGTLHRYAAFLEAARNNGFEVSEDLDVSDKAPPTMEYFMSRIPRYRERLVADLGLTGQQIDDLLASGRSYVDFYRRGVYAYRLLHFRR